MKQRGVIAPAVMYGLYALAGLFVISLAGGLIHSYNSGQKAKAELKICEDKNKALNDIVAKQNASITMHEDAAAKAQARSKKAQVAAAKLSEATRLERERLATLKGETCGEAVKAVREGLK